MLGYTQEDVNQMQESLEKAISHLPPDQHKLREGLENTQSFLDGLWSEGYFD